VKNNNLSHCCENSVAETQWFSERTEREGVGETPETFRAHW